MLWIHTCYGTSEKTGHSVWSVWEAIHIDTSHAACMYHSICIIYTYDICWIPTYFEYNIYIIYILTGPIQKGITHCLLPECSLIVWPFMNYCGSTHADLGKQRGLMRKYLLTYVHQRLPA